MRLIISRLMICALVAALTGVLPTTAPAQESLRIAAVVNDDVISAYDLAMRMRLTMITTRLPNTPEVRNRIGPPILRNLIDEKLMLQQAKEAGITIGQRAIDKAIAGLEQRNGMPPGGLDTFLQNAQIDKQTIVNQVKSSLAWARVVRRKFRQRIKVSDDEITETIARMEANKGKPEYRVSEIFLPVESTRREQEVRALAERLLSDIHNGGDFAALAQSFSKNASAQSGGDLGWVRQGDLDAEFEQVVSRLREGQVAGPLRSLTGFHLLQLVRKRADPGLGGGEEKVGLRQLYIGLPSDAGEQAVAQAMARAGELAAKATSCTLMDQLAPETGNDISGDMGTVELSGLPAPIRNVVQDLPIGQASKPLRSGGGVLVLMVCERSGKPDLGQVKKRIAGTLMEERMSTAARHYLRDLRRSAFVDVRI